LFEEEFHIPVKVTNDANAAAMGEMKYGAAVGVRDFLMVTLGTGVGSGFVSNGELIHGHDGFAGELGHVIAVRNGRSCGCGRNGCLETYCSATGIVRTATEMLQNYEGESLLKNFDNISAKDIAYSAQKNDTLAVKIFDDTARILGQTLADAVAITSPQLIVLFGGLAQAGDVLFTPLKKYVEDNLLNLYQNKINIIPSKLPESDAAVLGSAALVL
jgi:glucokinase (EC 2.7.1.2)